MVHSLTKLLHADDLFQGRNNLHHLEYTYIILDSNTAKCFKWDLMVIFGAQWFLMEENDRL